MYLIQLSINSKCEGITRVDLLAVVDSISLPRPETIIGDVMQALERWPEFAAQASVPDRLARQISSEHRVREATE